MDVPLPIINLDTFLADPSSPQSQAEADQVALGLMTYGALIIKDSRFSEAENERFLDLMEDYFAQPDELLKPDERPEWFYQAGVTLENTEKPKCGGVDASCQKFIAALEPAQRPQSMKLGHADPKARFFHRMGVDPPTTAFPNLNMTNVTPKAFEDSWAGLMDGWGRQLQQTAEGVSLMLARGLGLANATALVDAARHGPHLLAPTATNLTKYGKLGEPFAGFHSDLNFLSVHGRSRYPGLHIWARNTGNKLEVKLPPGHLLVQAGKQLEHLTGGLILAGFHEVVCTERTLAALEGRRADSKLAGRPEIRISSTFFHHLSSDYALRPGEFRRAVAPGAEAVRAKVAECEASAGGVEYEEGKLVGDLVLDELKSISLAAAA